MDCAHAARTLTREPSNVYECLWHRLPNPVLGAETRVAEVFDKFHQPNLGPTVLDALHGLKLDVKVPSFQADSEVDLRLDGEGLIWSELTRGATKDAVGPEAVYTAELILELTDALESKGYTPANVHECEQAHLNEIMNENFTLRENVRLT